MKVAGYFCVVAALMIVLLDTFPAYVVAAIYGAMGIDLIRSAP